MKLGSLALVPAASRTDLLAPSVAQALPQLSDGVEVAEIDPALSDTAAFCARYGVPLESAANCIIVEATRGETRKFAAVIVAGSARADINGVVRRTLDARRVSFAPMDEAVALTGMEFGAITPVGLPPEWPILLDPSVAAAEAVIIGSGVRKSKLAISGASLAKLPGAQILEGLVKVTTQV